jgi:hypothetical protein
MQYATHLSLHFCPPNSSSVFFVPRNLIVLHSEILFMLIFRDCGFPRKKCYTACSTTHQCCTLLYRMFLGSPVLYIWLGAEFISWRHSVNNRLFSGYCSVLSTEYSVLYRLRNEVKLHVILGFRREVDENCVLLGCCAISSGNSLPTFRDNLSVPSFRVRNHH